MTFPTRPGAIGHHILADFRGVNEDLLNDPARVRGYLEAAARAVNVTILGCHMHHFGEYAGVTGVLLLAESHLSIHTWPEYRFAAVDIFTCGDTPARAAIEYLTAAWRPEGVDVVHHPRGDKIELLATR